MIVHRCKISIIMQPHRVKMTRNRFLNSNASFSESTVDRALANSVSIEASKDTLFTLDDGGNKLPITVGISNSLLFDQLLRFGREVVPYSRQYLIDFCKLFSGNRRT